jgi:hypothetical protein
MKARNRAASSSTRARSTSTQRPTRSLGAAAAWIDRVGIAALLPGADLVLPSLWQAISGSRDVEWGTVDDTGRHVFTPEMAKCWAWKDDLPERGLACAGKHLGRWSALIAPRLLAPLYALSGRTGQPEDFRTGDFTTLQVEVAEAALAEGPCTGPELRALVGAEKKHVDAALVVLQRALVLTNAGVVEQKNGWGAIAVDVLARRWEVSKLPREGEARRLLAATVLASSGELSAADLGGALGWRLKRSRETLDELVERGSATRREQGVRALWNASPGNSA